MTRPSDRAIAQAFWELAAPEKDGGQTIGVGVQYLITRARELDATAAPVVVGEDMVRRALDAQPFADDNLGDRVWQLIGYDSDDAKKIIRAALTAALAGEVTAHPGTAPPEE